MENGFGGGNGCCVSSRQIELDKLSVCNDGNRSTSGFSGTLVLPSELEYTGGLPAYPAFDIPSLESGECVTVHFSTRIADGIAGGTRIRTCFLPDSRSAPLCISEVEVCVDLVTREVVVDPCATPTILQTRIDSAKAEGSGEELMIPVFYSGLEPGMDGPDTIEIRCRYTAASSVIATDDPDQLTRNTETEGWMVETDHVAPGELTIRLIRGTAEPQ